MWLLWIAGLPFAALFVAAGCGHFRKSQDFVGIMRGLPLPALHPAANYVSGAAEVVLGCGLVLAPLLFGPSASAQVVLGLFWLVVVMTPANVNMYVNDVPFGSTKLSYGWTGTHAVRFALQAVLLLALLGLHAGWQAQAVVVAAAARRRELHAASSAGAAFSTGDLVFVQPQLSRAQPLDAAILDVGAATIDWLRSVDGVDVRSNETAVHVALAWRNASSGELSFIEATPPAVRLSPEAAFWDGWRPSNASFFAARLRDPALRRLGGAAAALALSQLGTPYADDYAPPMSGRFYCSSLVSWAYQTAAAPGSTPLRGGVFVDRPFPLIFVPRAFWADYYARLGLQLPPPNATGSNPTLLLHSPAVTFAAVQPRQAEGERKETAPPVGVLR